MRGPLQVASLCWALAAAGCGGEYGPSAFEEPQAGAAAWEEPVGQTQEALESIYDAPAAAATTVFVDGLRYIWVFACDRNGNLRRTTTRDIDFATPVWSDWDDYGPGCVSTPSVISDHNMGGRTNSAVSVFVTWNDGYLWEARWAKASGRFVWVNVSGSAGWGPSATLSPVVVHGNRYLTEIGVAARASNYEVFTFDRYDGTWHYSPVLDGNGAVVRSPNTLTSLPDAFISMSGVSYLAGRGLSAGNDVTGWVARRNAGARTSMRALTPPGNFSPIGTPVLSKEANRTGALFYRDFRNALLSMGIPNGNPVFQYQNCSVGGSPSPYPSMHSGFVRATSGALLQYSTQDPQRLCFLAGDVRFVESGIFTHWDGAYYKGRGGELMHFHLPAGTASQGFEMGLRLFVR